MLNILANMFQLVCKLQYGPQTQVARGMYLQITSDAEGQRYGSSKNIVVTWTGSISRPYLHDDNKTIILNEFVTQWHSKKEMIRNKYTKSSISKLSLNLMTKFRWQPSIRQDNCFEDNWFLLTKYFRSYCICRLQFQNIFRSRLDAFLTMLILKN